MDPSGKKQIFVVYCKVSNALRIYILGYHHMEISRDVTYDEDTALEKSRKYQLEESYEEVVAPRDAELMKEVEPSPDVAISEEHDMLVP